MALLSLSLLVVIIFFVRGLMKENEEEQVDNLKIFVPHVSKLDSQVLG